MRYYRLAVDMLSSDTEVYIDDIENDAYKRLRPSIFRAEPIKKWPARLFALSNGTPGKLDFLPAMYKRVYVSKRAKLVFNSFADLPAQFLPVKLGETDASVRKTYFMLHVTAICSSLNMKRTRCEMLDIDGSEEQSFMIVGRKNKQSITLSRSKLKKINFPIYCERGCEELLFLREDLINRLEQAGLRGLEYASVHID